VELPRNLGTERSSLRFRITLGESHLAGNTIFRLRSFAERTRSSVTATLANSFPDLLCSFSGVHKLLCASRKEHPHQNTDQQDRLAVRSAQVGSAFTVIGLSLLATLEN